MLESSITIEMNAIRCKLGDTLLINNYTNRFSSPQLISIFGNNGTGKTTFLKLISGIIIPCAGEILVNSHNIVNNWLYTRHLLGVSIYSERAFNYRLTGYQNCRYYASLNKHDKRQFLSQCISISDTLGVESIMKQKFSALSYGQRKIFGTILAEASSRGLVILDEPTIGLDLDKRKIMINHLNELSNKGYLIICSTHDPELLSISSLTIDTNSLITNNEYYN